MKYQIFTNALVTGFFVSPENNSPNKNVDMDISLDTVRVHKNCDPEKLFEDSKFSNFSKNGIGCDVVGDHLQCVANGNICFFLLLNYLSRVSN